MRPLQPQQQSNLPLRLTKVNAFSLTVVSLALQHPQAKPPG
jgi:hypothetical protein